MKKRILPVFLALVTVLGMLPATVFAEETGSTATLSEAAAEAKAAVDVLKTELPDNSTWSHMFNAVLSYNAVPADDPYKDELTTWFASVEEISLADKACPSYGKDLGVMAPFTGVKVLNLSNTGVTTTGGLLGCTALTDLNLSGNAITTIGGLVNCKQLTTLDLTGNTQLSEFGALVDLDKLTTLKIGGTGATNQVYGSLVGLKLEELDISNTNISDIGGLTNDNNSTDPVITNQIKNTLKTLNISETGVKTLDALWDSTEETASFPQLTKLNAERLVLDSVAGLVKIATAEGFDADEVDWNLSGSTLPASATTDVAAIEQAFKKDGTTSPSFTAPSVPDAPTAAVITSAQSWQTTFAADLKEDGTGLDWDTLITSVYYYRQVQDYVESLDTAQDVTDEQKTSAASALSALTTYYTTQVTKLDMSGQNTSKYAISTGALTDFKALTDLNLSNTGIKDSGGLAELTQLKNLNLSNNEGINETHFGALTGLELETLDLSNTSVQDIGGLTGTENEGDENKVAASLESLNISGTKVTKLESICTVTTNEDGVITREPTFPSLKTLTAQNLELTSISGLAELTKADDFNAANVTWNLNGSNLSSDAGKNVQTITDAFKDTNSAEFVPPTVPMTTFTIRFAAGEGTGTMEDVLIPNLPDAQGTVTYNLPETPDFTAPDSKKFDRWATETTGASVSNGTLYITDQVEDNVIVVTAQWVVENPSVYATAVTITSVENSTIKAGETLKLTATVTPDNADNKTITWTSSNRDVAYVNDDGTVVAVGEGTVTITASVAGQGATISDTIEITVSEVKVTGITLNKTALTLTTGSSETLTATITPEDASNKRVTWTSSNTSVATVDENGKVTAVSAGTATITVTAKDGSNKTASCTVTVKSTSSSGNTPGGNTSSGGGGGGSSSSGYSVSIPRVTGGTVTASPTNAEKGNRVTLTVKPSAGYVLDKLTVTDAKGNQITLTDIGSNQYTFTMPDSKVTVDASFVRSSAPASTSGFVDVDPNAYYAAPVEWAVSNGITAGTGANTFGPNSPCTRAQIMTFLWRAAGSPSAGGSNPFADVSADSYYAQAVQWAVAQGITSGTSETTFSPDAVCTRAQAMAFLYKAMGSPAFSSNSSFVDVNESDYFFAAVQWAVENGVTSGTGANAFSPDAQCTRAQIVTFLYHAFA